MKASALRGQLLAWYRRASRDLPWRRTRDPYAIWISEVMLQQTRVDTVIPYFERFLDRFPTVSALADADPAEVQAAWSGLGYYRRARLMLEAATSMVRDHGGHVPSALPQLRELPGFGRYTAGAVASIAFGVPTAAVDGNVARVVARVFGIEGDVTAGVGRDRVWAEAEVLAEGEAPGELNQALIELGALVCTPKSPGCGACPVSGSCVALKTDRVASIPPPRVRAKKSEIHATGLLLLDAKGRVRLERQPVGGLFAELWCLPMLDGLLDPAEAADEAARKYGLEIEGPMFTFELKHVLTHREIHTRILRPASWHARPKRSSPETSAVPLAKLSTLGLPSFTVRALEAALPRHLLASVELPRRRTARRDPAQASLPLSSGKET